MHVLSQVIVHMVETLDCILGATRRIQGFTQMPSNRDVEMFKFPSEDLSATVSDSMHRILLIKTLANETTKSVRLV